MCKHINMYIIALVVSLHCSIVFIHSFYPQIRYVESSAKLKVHVDKAFHDLVRVIRKAQKPETTKKEKKKRRCNIL